MLFFNYGSMNAGKSALLIREACRLKGEGEHVLVWSSELDMRDEGFFSLKNSKL